MDDIPDDSLPLQEDAATDLLSDIQRALCDKSGNKLFQMPSDKIGEVEHTATPKLGLPEDCVVRPHFNILVLKPQLALRSEAVENAIILLAVEEVGVKGFKVEDVAAKDVVTAEVLSRSVSRAHSCPQITD